MGRFEPHRHEAHGYQGKSHLTLQQHVKAWHRGLEPPGVEQDASWDYLATRHQREHEEQDAPQGRSLTVRELVTRLMQHEMDAPVYVGKGCGPLAAVKPAADGTRMVILSPQRPAMPGGE